jgi:hypothetical protein
MLPLAALTPADLCVALGLILLAVTMWALRGAVGFVLSLLPLLASVLAPVCAWGLYRLGESMSWDSPGSPAILVVIGALGGAVLMSLAAWITLALQLMRRRRPRAPRSREGAAGGNAVRVAGAILATVWLLSYAYLDYRAHRPSHEAIVQQMYFAPDGEALYSLDRSGVLKRWNLRDVFQAQAWSLTGAGAASDLALSGDGRALLVLAGDELSAWSLDDGSAARRLSRINGVLGVEALGGDHIAVLMSEMLSIRDYSDLRVAKATAPLRSTALTLCGYAGQGIVVGTTAPALEYYRAGSNPRTLERSGETSLDLVPRQLRSDRSGRYVVVYDPGAGMVVVDAQALVRDPISGYFEPILFEVSQQAQLLIAQVNDVRGYDLAQKSSQPLYNHGGTIEALAASPTSDAFAVANGQNIWIHSNSRAYAGAERWLNGRVELSGWLRIP